MAKKFGFITSAFIKICLINFISMFGQSMTNTLIPKFADSLGAAPLIVGVVTSSFSISALLIKPFSGPAIDSFNKKYVLLMANLFIAIAYYGYSISSSVQTIIIFRLLHGFGLGFTVIACLTLVSEAVPDSKLTSGIAVFSIAAAVAQAIGPGLGLALSRQFGYRLTFQIGMSVMLIAAFAVLALDNSKKSNVPFKVSYKNIYAKEALIPAIIMFFLAAVYVNINSYLVLYAMEVNVTNIGLFYTVNAIVLLISRPIIGRLSDRFGVIRVLPLAIVFYGISLVMISYSNSIERFILAAVISAFGYGACQPIIQSLCMKSVTRDRRGSASATSYYGTDLGYLIGPLLSGIVIERFGYAIMFRTIPLMLVFPLLIFFLYIDKLNAIDMKSRRDNLIIPDLSITDSFEK
ncbi:MFS transporter [Youngiibacter fragilis]|uniref:MFS transporter n=1 Tax=Youngiibacter fragilis 232.1 TaxID=994573 RepID=V7I434_9CLOT|nr:MFS transporter [Youngiibacter fragilis 232.1]